MVQSSVSMAETPISIAEKAKSRTVGVDSSVNASLLHAQYAVRGAISERAAEIQKELASGKHKYPFESIVYCNIGNPQSFNQKPISFARRVIACCECPELTNKGVFPDDVVARSKDISEHMHIGAYTASSGDQYLRSMVAHGISKRDEHECSPENVFLSNGASASVHSLFQTMINDEKDAFLVPIPQYPLYSAALTLYGGTLIPYYLDEDSNWGIKVDSIDSLIAEKKSRGLRVRGMVVINPGNPTGQVLSEQNLKRLCQVCTSHGVPIIADEVYQDNIWAEGKSFVSFRKVALECRTSQDPVVFSLHSTSKGFFGECGHRGGYLEVLNCPQPILQQLRKLQSVSLCSSTVGQVMVGCMMKPPVSGDASYDEYTRERSAILDSLRRRAHTVAAAVRELEGVTCCEPEGALYAFPRLTIPEAAQAEAAKQGVQPDFLYCMELLNATGIVTVPGSGFKQVPGTFHMRLTILPQESALTGMLQRLAQFHRTFMDKYR